MKLDSIDLRILDELQHDGALSNVQLARRVHLSPSPCLTRVRALDRYGVSHATLPPDAPRSLLRGMFVEVWLQLEVSQPLVSVPEEAVRPSGDVFVMRDGRLHVFHPRPFHAAAGRVLYAQDESGLLPTDRVVVSQLASPRDGMEIAEATAP